MEIGYIYKICNKNTDKIYIGSTVNEIEKRLNQHKYDYKQYLNNKSPYITSFEIVNDQTCFVELFAEVYFNDKHELHKKEKIFIQMYSDICVNKNIPTRTIKEYNEDNKEKVKEKIKECHEKNKDKYKEKRNEKINCNICNKLITKYNIPRHQKSSICIKKDSQNTNNNINNKT